MEQDSTLIRISSVLPGTLFPVSTQYLLLSAVAGALRVRSLSHTLYLSETELLSQSRPAPFSPVTAAWPLISAGADSIGIARASAPLSPRDLGSHTHPKAEPALFLCLATSCVSYD